MTAPTSLVLGRWEFSGKTRTRTLRYGSKAHGYEVVGEEMRTPDGIYRVTITSSPFGSNEARSPQYTRSYKAHEWFLTMARMLVEKAQKEGRKDGI